MPPARRPNPEVRPWKVTVTDPTADNAPPITILLLRDRAVATTLPFAPLLQH